ncbi:MAG TPA: protein phosphatase CheZ, partial [Pseudoxanthomonas sp.]
MNAVADVTGARAALVERLQHALDALEQGDEAGWRRELDTIAAWRTQPMMQGLGRLARELAQTLGELPPTDAGELDDACSRLDHVVEMTEQASHKTLDLAEQCRGYATQLKGTALSAEQAALVDSIGKGLSEMALAQSYQDLTGQIIRRVAGIVRRVHEGFGALGLPP